MSLARLVQDFYSFSEDGAQAVLDLVTLEKDWRRQEWTPRGATAAKIGDPAEMKTAGDFIEFLQIVGQGNYFGGHNRAEFKDNDKSVSLNSYLRLAQRMGMIDEMSYTLEEKPTYMAVFGSSISQYKLRLQALKRDLLRGIIPTSNIIDALGTDARQLGIGVFDKDKEDEELLKQDFESKDVPPHELAMVQMLTENMIHELPAIHSELKDLECRSINATSIIKDRQPGITATTADTVIALKRAIEKEVAVEKKESIATKPITVFYSTQPFGPRQGEDASSKMGEGYRVVTVASALSKETFIQHPKAKSLVISEVARLLNIKYCAQQALLQNLKSQPLNEQQKIELQLLTLRVSKPALHAHMLFGKKSSKGQMYKWTRRRFTQDKDRHESFEMSKDKSVSRAKYQEHLLDNLSISQETSRSLKGRR